MHGMRSALMISHALTGEPEGQKGPLDPAEHLFGFVASDEACEAAARRELRALASADDGVDVRVVAAQHALGAVERQRLLKLQSRFEEIGGADRRRLRGIGGMASVASLLADPLFCALLQPVKTHAFTHIVD